MLNNVCIIIRRPLGDERFTLGLRTALAVQSEGYETDLVFMGDSLHSLTGSLPGYMSATLAAFTENEGRIRCLDEELDSLPLDGDAISLAGLDRVDEEDLQEILEDADTIHSF